MTATQALPTADLARGECVPIGSDTYNQVLGFLYREASLLDAIKLKEWSALLSPELIYTVPLRQTRPMAQHEASIIRTVQHYHDDYRSIMAGSCASPKPRAPGPKIPRHVPAGW